MAWGVIGHLDISVKAFLPNNYGIRDIAVVTSVVLLFATNLVINDERRREDGTVTMMSGTYPWSSGNDSHCE
jgi:hypothetical protein